MSTQRNTHVLVTGTPGDGFSFFGPITPNDPVLEEFTDGQLKDEYWWYAPLAPLPLAEPAPDISTIYLLSVENNHGEDISVHPSIEASYVQLRDLLMDIGALEEGEVLADEEVADRLGREGVIWRIEDYPNPHA